MKAKASSIEDTIFALSHYGHGIVIFEDEKGHLEGILTDGDIRRLLSTHRNEIFELDLSRVINRKPTAIEPGCMAVEALKIMEEREKPLNVVPVVSQKKFEGVLRLHELLSVS